MGGLRKERATLAAGEGHASERRPIRRDVACAMRRASSCAELSLLVMQAVRAPAVAGSFYPADPSRLRDTVARLLAAAQHGSPPKALIAPHAGYVYSGAVAASAFRRVEDA